MSETPRMNAATTSNERYRVGCELERELAAIVPRLNAEWQAKLVAMEKERNVALAKVSKDGRRIAELEAAEERLLKERDEILCANKELNAELMKEAVRADKMERERDALLAEKRALTDMLFAAGMKRDEQTARAEKAEAAWTQRTTEIEARLAMAEAKLKRADAILLEVWGAYNRIGDALKVKK